MGDSGDLREDLKIPDGELGTQLRAEYDAGKELLVSCNSDFNDSPQDFCSTVPISTCFNPSNHVYLLLQCTVLKSCGEECVIAIKTNTALDK